MQPDLPLLTVSDLERMTPEDARAEFERRLVRNPDDLDPAFRARIEATAERLRRDLFNS